jgi:hypothetical protein
MMQLERSDPDFPAKHFWPLQWSQRRVVFPCRQNARMLLTQGAERELWKRF